MPSKRKVETSKDASSASIASKKTKTREKVKIQGDVDLIDGGTPYSVEEEVKVEVEVEEEIFFSEEKEITVSEEEETDAIFVGDPFSDTEARQRWPLRYGEKTLKKESAVKNGKENAGDEISRTPVHYKRAKVEGTVYDLNDDAYAQAGEGEDCFICKIIEFFEDDDGTPYFSAQWFYRAKDTVIQKLDKLVDKKRVFFSEIKDDNPLSCLVKKLKIALVPLNVDVKAKMAAIPECDYYCDMKYLLPYSTFVALLPETKAAESETSLTTSSDVVKPDNEVDFPVEHSSEVRLLDLYCGCGAMSTGLCLGANLSGLKLVTRWAVDFNEHACHSLKLNHPETEVRNESVEDFLLLLKAWKQLCCVFNLINCNDSSEPQPYAFLIVDDEKDDAECEEESEGEEDGSEVFEVEKILEICYGDPKKTRERGMYLKVRWQNYGPEEDTWEPIAGLGNCQEKIKEFVMHMHRSKILPLPGDVDVICGGPPCQGISGFNRFRNKDNPLEDEKNKQLLVYLEMVDYLKPKYVLMENVVDILKFANGFLGRYALGRLIDMNYQTRMGMMAAGAYGLPQYRMRFFLWGARPNEKLPQYPLPTHDVITRGVIPLEFERNTVAYDEGEKETLEKMLLLEDAISDLPAICNDEHQDEMSYDQDPKTAFQRFIRLKKDGSLPILKAKKPLLFDHRPLELNNDDYQRSCQIPKKKGANFRDLSGVRVRPDNKVEWDPDVKRVYLDSGKPLVPDYAMSFVGGSSSKPFARLWWDETVPTVVTRAEPHNQAILHPEQDRVLSIRENARLQGFPDYYKLSGPVKESIEASKKIANLTDREKVNSWTKRVSVMR